MRAIITSFGTTGDILPLCALALELRQHGHRPVVMFPSHFAPLAQKLDLEFAPYGPDVADIHHEIIKAQMSGPLAEDKLRSLFVQLGQATPRAFSDLSVVCRNADVLICSNELPNQPPLGLMVHETTRIPFVSVQLCYPYEDNSPYLAEGVAAINRFRGFLRLPPIQANGPNDTNISPQLALFALSRHIYPPRPTWPAHCHVTGFFFAEDGPWEPDPSLTAFLEDGQPPVFLTFGSMINEDPSALSKLIAEAIRRAGCRAIVQTGWGGLSIEPERASNIYQIGFAPHSSLFPRAACVVHHGGAGTSAATFRAGVPSVVVPHLGDQFELARCAYEEGCSAAPLPFAELTAERLSASIKEVLSDERYQQSARSLQDKLLEENGVQTARRLIEQLLERCKG
ncbi:MAG TPA: glycosyltransferase [Pyrinomonadaceae bacterium]|jgi:sterol 3beta-glucosyltransferase